MDFKLMTPDDLKQMREEIISEVSDVLSTQNYNKTANTLLKAKEVCERLRCSHGTLYNLRKNGILKAVKIGGTYLYSVQQIDSILETKNNN